MILVPIKNLADAKQRLSPVLNPDERFALALAMCEDVLEALARWQGRTAVAVVTTDSYARDLASAVCRKRGAESTLVVPADIPLIDSPELQKIADSAPKGGAVLVPDAARRGTNAAWRCPGDLFPLRFGNDSFLPHLAAAKATGLPCVVLELPGIARDVDRPEDLRELAAASGDRRSQKLVRSWNLGNRKCVEHSQVEHHQVQHGVRQR